MAGIIPAAGAVSSNSKFRRRRYTPIADINVTPLVDVMLVLLIIFMITAPLLQVGVPVDLPKTSAQQVGGKDEPMVVSVNSRGEVFLERPSTTCPSSPPSSRPCTRRSPTSACSCAATRPSTTAR